MSQLRTNERLRLLVVFWLQALPEASQAYTSCNSFTRYEGLGPTQNFRAFQRINCHFIITKSFQHAVKHFEKGMLNTLQTATLENSVLQVSICQVYEDTEEINTNPF